MSANFTQLAALAVGGSWTVNKIISTPPVNAPISSGPYRPRGWQKPQKTAISVNWPTQSVSHTIVSDTGQPISTGQQAQFTPATYFFDAVLRVIHSQTLRATEHPIQTGAAITDHTYKLPSRLILEIAMSDAMDSIVKGVYTSDPSKSVSAYQILRKLQDSKLPLQVTTRLDSYVNMIIENLQVPDDYTTQFGLKATVTLRQIMTGTVSTVTVPVSIRPQTTNSTPLGTKNPVSVPQSIQQTHQDDSGNWFSNLLSNFAKSAFSSPGPGL